MIDLPERNQKPRSYGLTCWIDSGLTVAQAEALLTDYGDFVDVVKLGIGSAYITPRLKEKVSLYKSAGMKLYFGGTLFEKFCHQDSLDAYKRYLDSFGIDCLEISSGTIDLSLGTSLEILKDFKQNFDCFCEVGTKDKTADVSADEWIQWLQTFLNEGAKYVIAEGRDSGTAGIFHPSGELRKDLINMIVSHVDPKRLIFEAPTTSSQMHLINTVGADVNLGNINPRDTLTLESQRRGLRYETFFIE